MKEKAFIAIVFAAIIASLGGLFIRFISMDAGAIAWLRTVVPTIVLAAIVLKDPLPKLRKGHSTLILLSFLSSLRIYLFILAYIYTTIANAAIIFYIYPIFTLLVANRILGEKISRKQVVLILLAFIGLIIVYSDKPISFGDRDFLGMLFAISAAVIFAFIMVLMKKLSDSYSKNQILFYQNLSGAILFLPFFLMDFDQFNLPNFGYGVSYGILVGLGTYTLILIGLKHMKASITSSLMYLEIPCTIIVGYIFLNESLSFNMIAGGSLIIISSFLLRK